MIAHDMRTPLNALKFVLSAAQHASDKEEILRAITMANRNADALPAIIESMLEKGASGEGRLKLAEWKPIDLVAGAIDQIVPLAEQKCSGSKSVKRSRFLLFMWMASESFAFW